MISTEMMNDLCMFSFGLSCGFWMIYGLYTAIRIQHFIVKRYEIETDLMVSIFFKEHAMFKVFRDVDNPLKVLFHFTENELRRVKKYGISSIILVLHMTALYIIDSLLPGLLK